MKSSLKVRIGIAIGIYIVWAFIVHQFFEVTGIKLAPELTLNAVLLIPLIPAIFSIIDLSTTVIITVIAIASLLVTKEIIAPLFHT
ncbi:MAG: hypothetical protein DRN04_11930 [Thermoprotei archaeon]|nr:MAG: hypothetical protein DRN04_11930 [Thermoprotei archaeon]